MPPGSRLLGLDVGTKTIGTALSDTRLVIASPLETIRRRRFRDDAAALFALIDRHGVGGLVIGLPLALAGGNTPRTQSVRQFARNVLALRDMPVAFWDERLSTAAVTREMIAHDMTRKRRAEIVDRVAAAYILQGCLDAIGRPAPMTAMTGLSRALRLFGLLLGIAVLAWLVAHADLAELIGVFPRIGWGFLAILAVRAATILINATAWRCLVPRRDRPSLRELCRDCAGSARRSTRPCRRRRSAAKSCAPDCCSSGSRHPARGAASVAVDFSVDDRRGDPVHGARLRAAGLARRRGRLVAGGGQRGAAAAFRLVELGVAGQTAAARCAGSAACRASDARRLAAGLPRSARRCSWSQAAMPRWR